jgi:hypothetical protein
MPAEPYSCELSAATAAFLERIGRLTAMNLGPKLPAFVIGG